MITTHKTTKTVSIVLALIMLLSIIFVAGTTTASAASAGRVSLYSASVYSSNYGVRTYEVFVQTKDNARNQNVYIHYSYLNNNNWLDAKADYYTTLNDGSKIWRATFSTYTGRYVVKYIADGVTYWDNNNGKNYNGAEVIGSAPVAAKRLAYQYSGYSYRIDAVLQNYAYHKNVFVRYSTDGWKTFTDVPMSYTETNSDGTETWTATLINNFTQGSFKYAICYRVNGCEYWANNFGADYSNYYYTYH